MASVVTVFLVIALLLLGFCGFALWRSRRELADLREGNNSLRNELEERGNTITRLETELKAEEKSQQQKDEWFEESRKKLTDTFQNLANQIFEDKSVQFQKRNKEGLEALLSPLKDNIKEFKKQFEDTHKQEFRERTSLKLEIEQLTKLNNQISEDAANLTRALTKDSKAQGDWGEFVLESLLEASGLVEGREYEVQKSLKGEEGGLFRPDVIVHLPGSRDIIVDSKVSLTAWTKYCQEETEEDREQKLQDHVQSVRNHIRELASKNYQNLIGVNTLDYVFLFMPVEAAYVKTMEVASNIIQDAFDKKVIFMGPTTLLAILKIVENIWRLEKQNQYATEIAGRAGQLYDKFVGFVDDLDSVGQQIDKTQKSFESARNKLTSGKGNLVRQAEMLQDLGAKTTKQLPAGLGEDTGDASKDS